MEAAKQKVRATTTHKKEEEKKAKLKEGESSSAPKAVGKGAAILPKKLPSPLGMYIPRRSHL